MNRYSRVKLMALSAILLSGFFTATASVAAKWANPELLVTPETVKKNIDKPDWVVVDCRDLKAYAKGHIPGAISLGKRCKKARMKTSVTSDYFFLAVFIALLAALVH